jgi:DNA-directed RNA polymerase delta subunit
MSNPVKNEVKKNEMDWACEILEKKQEPMLYLDLIQAIAKKIKIKAPLETEGINTVYTAMNMDNRLEYQGDGYWFLADNRVMDRRER